MFISIAGHDPRNSGGLRRATGAVACGEAVQPQLRRPGDPDVLRAATRHCAGQNLRLSIT